jgi:RNA polymerase sigma-70 factor (ECF subfamily)
LNTDITVSEIELMQRIFESDSNAIEVLYDKYASLLFTLIKKIVKDEKQAEDILEEIFFIVKKKINYFDFNTKNTYAWLINLAKNKAIYELRNGKILLPEDKQEPGNDYIIPHISHLIEPLDLDKAFELKPKIETALNSLTDAQQYVIYLAFYEGLTQEEIAEKLKIPVSTVKSKIKTSLVNLNEKLTGKPSVFSIKNESVEMIYPYVLGCLSIENHLETFDQFKSTEPFPWKTLGDYQNLVSLLPVILDLEMPLLNLKEKIINRLNNFKNDTTVQQYPDDKFIYEPVLSATSKVEIESAEESKNIITQAKYDRVENLTETQEKAEWGKRNIEDFERVTPFKPEEISIKEPDVPEEKTLDTLIKDLPEEVIASQNEFEKKRSYTSIIIIALIVIFIVSAVMAYLFYNDRTFYYESQIENLNARLNAIINENQSRPVIPGLGDLRNPQTIKLENTGESLLSDGNIILSLEDKRGYLNILNLPILDSESAYQLWGNFKGDFISLGVFKVSSRPDYYPFTIPEFVNGGSIEFYVIESSDAGSKRPGSRVYLKGRVRQL